MEISKRREAEMAKVRRDLEEATLNHEATLSNIRHVIKFQLYVLTGQTRLLIQNVAKVLAFTSLFLSLKDNLKTELIMAEYFIFFSV